MREGKLKQITVVAVTGEIIKEKEKADLFDSIGKPNK